VPEEEHKEQHGQDERDKTEDPDDQGEEHTAQDDSLLVILACEDSDLLEELDEALANILGR
jgi:hypothetical protein